LQQELLANILPKSESGAMKNASPAGNQIARRGLKQSGEAHA
jgi:hypothetical protein